MNTQVIITLDGVKYMVNISIERVPSAIVYHVVTPRHFVEVLPATVDIIKPDHTDQPQYNEQALTERGNQIIQAVWQELKELPMQFKGNGQGGRK